MLTLILLLRHLDGRIKLGEASALTIVFRRIRPECGCDLERVSLDELYCWSSTDDEKRLQLISPLVNLD